MAQTRRKTDETAPEPHAPKTRDEIVDENRHEVPLSSNRERMLAQSGATEAEPAAGGPQPSRASEFEELTGKTPEDPSAGYPRLMAYGILAAGILVLLFMIFQFAM